MRRKGQQAENDKTERVTGLGRRTREEIAKWNQMTALRFQTGGRHQTSPASLRGIKGGKLRKSESSLICVVIAEGSTNALPISKTILAHFFIPDSFHNKNILLLYLINDILKLVIEFLYFVVTIV
ncbi:hypothetical protein [Thiolapillus sp.]|uniref:hypothetical protein n=1 Tax=Thiolapillus sp. TaxID=2017437 RepID=UPI003AF7A7B6